MCSGGCLDYSSSILSAVEDYPDLSYLDGTKEFLLLENCVA